MKKIAAVCAGTLLMLICSAEVMAQSRSRQPADVRKTGGHDGENIQLDVKVLFYGQFGETITDENGTTYCIEGWPPFGESKVYPPEYWGVFPLFFFDVPVGVQVSVENLDPRNVAKVRVKTEAYALRTDGTHGAPLCLPSETDIEVAGGATEYVDASIVPAFSEDSESGLDRMVVKILHPNKGQDDPEAVYDDPALILMKEAVFCPPILSQPVQEIVNQMLVP